jgi:hypothetical protein
MFNFKEHENYIVMGGCLAAFFVPLKLSWAYAAIIPTMLMFISWHRWNITEITDAIPAYIRNPLIGWFILVILAAPFGIDPTTTIIKGLRFGFSILLIPLYMFISHRITTTKFLGFLVFGQTISASHTVLSSILPQYMSRTFPGAVTESGQLALTIFAALGCLFYLFYTTESLKLTRAKLVIPILVLAIATYTGFYGINMGLASSLLIGVALISALIVSVRKHLLTESTNSDRFYSLLFLAIPLLFSALLINLKRGPWLGVSISILALLLIYNRKLILPLLGLIIITAVTVPQIHTRLIQSSQDFFIEGGRNQMWQVGIELASKFPVGIGFQNSPFLKKYDPTIPSMHSHFHNNALNVLVETGWLGLFILASWIAGLFVASKNSKLTFPNSLLLNCVIAAIGSWQLAGIVEYNFGDSEVLQVAFIILGALASLTCKSDRIATAT